MLLAGRQLHLLIMVQFSSYRKWLHFVIVCAVFIASWTWRDMGYVWQVPLSELCQWISLSLLIIMLCYFSAVLSCQTLLPLFNLSLPPSLLLSLSLSLSLSLTLSLSPLLSLTHSLVQPPVKQGCWIGVHVWLLLQRYVTQHGSRFALSLTLLHTKTLLTSI